MDRGQNGGEVDGILSEQKVELPLQSGGAMFERLRIQLSIARSNTLLISGSHECDVASPFIQSGSAFHDMQTWEEC